MNDQPKPASVDDIQWKVNSSDIITWPKDDAIWGSRAAMDKIVSLERQIEQLWEQFNDERERFDIMNEKWEHCHDKLQQAKYDTKRLDWLLACTKSVELEVNGRAIIDRAAIDEAMK
jgi:hypothetical protein